jgi:hypothetical protein
MKRLRRIIKFYFFNQLSYNPEPLKMAYGRRKMNNGIELINNRDFREIMPLP